MPENVLRRLASLAAFCVVVLLLTLLVQLVWTGLLTTNLRVSPAVSWSVAVMAVVLWAIWRYSGGSWWPGSTREARRRYRRSAPVPPRAFAWAMGAGLLGLCALIAAWLVMGRLIRVPGNSTAGFTNYSPLTFALVIVMASLVGAMTEELGLRGYMLTRLESPVGGWVAVVIVALLIAPGHGMTQGFALPTLLWYFAADMLFGSLALLTRSIVPGMIVHFIGLLAFFSVIWPTDRYREPVSLGQQNPVFWIELVAGVALAGLSILALRRLSAATHRPSEFPVESV